MSEQAELQVMMRQARELYAWQVALQEAGFPELQAFALLTPLLMSGQIRLEADHGP